MIYIIAVCFPIAIIGFFLLENTSRLLTNYHQDLLISDSMRVRTILFEITTQIYNISETIAFEDTLQQVLSSQEKGAERGAAYSYATLNNYISSHAEIEDIIIYTDNVNAAKYMHFTYADNGIQKQEWYQKAVGQAGTFWIPMEKKDQYGNSYWNLALVRRITVIGSDYQAVLVIMISDNYLQTRLRSNEYRITVSADNRKIFYNSTRMDYGETQPFYIDYADEYYQYLGPVWEQANKFLANISTLHLYQTDSKIYIATISESAYGDMSVIIVTCLLIILTALIVPAILIHFFTRYFTGRVNVLRDEMKKASNEEYDIPDYDIEIITDSKHMADLFEETVVLGSQPKKVSNWLMGETLRLLKEKGMDPEDICFSPENLAKLIALVDAKAINSSVAKEVFEVMFEKDLDPGKYVEEKGLKTVNDEGALRKTVEEVIAANPQSVADFKSGKEKAIGFLVGQTMKAMKGKADPGMVNRVLREML